MRRIRQAALAATFVLSLALSSLLAAPASADLPPPDGTKRVGFAVAVENLAAFPDMVVLAYPWSMSNGAPTQEHARLEDGKPLEVGRRSAPPKLWAATKADYEAFAATYKPARAYEDPPLEAFFKSAKVHPCDAEVAPEHQLPKSDARDQIVQRLRAEKVDKSTCHITTIAAATQPDAARPDAAKPDAAKPDAKPADSTAPSSAPSTSPSGTTRGCAGCATSAEDVDASQHLIAAAFLAIGAGVALRRRR